jgi:hypothetical protein
MAWTRRQLDQAVMDYERVLTEAQQAPGSIRTAVGDARRFVRWLDGEFEPQARKDSRVSLHLRSAYGTRRTALRGLVSAPKELMTLIDQWNKQGQPPQVGIEWPRERWRTAFPKQQALWRDLPELLDRKAVRAITDRAAESPAAAETALIATLAWGFGWVGYGPHRADKILISTPDSRRHLQAVAALARVDGAMAAYRGLAHEHRIKGLGPAFGTKFIAFCQPAGRQPVALIHDQLVGAWLATHGRPDLAAASWSSPRYEAYLDQIHVWADALGVNPETVEYLIFQAEADVRGNQWATRR